MALTTRIVAEVLRQRLAEGDGVNLPRIVNAIPEVLKAVGRKIAADSNLRPLLTTDRTTVTAVITGGFVNLVPLYQTNRILIEYIDRGRIYHASSVYPLRQLSPKARPLKQLFVNFAYYAIDGDKLDVFSAAGTALTGTLSFAVPYYPATLADLPESEEVEKLFLDKMLEWVQSGRSVNQDAAGDGEN